MLKHFLLGTTLILGLAAGCGTDDPAPPIAYDTTGLWEGEWVGGTVNGNVNVEMVLEGTSHMTGTAVLDGNPCLAGATMHGLVDQENGDVVLLIIDPDLTDEERDAYQIEAIAAEVGEIPVGDPDETDRLAALGYEHLIVTKGSYDPDTRIMFLNYRVIDWAFCAGAVGTISVELQVED